MAERIPCPFIYASGKRCTGCVSDWRLYGHRKGDPLFFAKKVRLWCSEKDDHAGAVPSWEGKERMEFYPNRLPPDVYAAIEADMAKESV